MSLGEGNIYKKPWMCHPKFFRVSLNQSWEDVGLADLRLIGIIPELHCRTGWSERLGLREAEGLGSWDAANCRKHEIFP
jgi:hypothetical protein